MTLDLLVIREVLTWAAPTVALLFNAVTHYIDHKRTDKVNNHILTILQGITVRMDDEKEILAFKAVLERHFPELKL